MKNLFLLGLLFVVNMKAVSAQKSADDSYTFNIRLIWNGEIIEEGEDYGEGVDNFTQLFSDKGDYTANTIWGGGYKILDYKNNVDLTLTNGNGFESELTAKNQVTFSLTATGESDEIVGYNAEKYTWKDNKGNSGEIWYATDLDFPSASKGVNYPFYLNLPDAPSGSGLGVVLKVVGKKVNGQTFDVEVTTIMKEDFTINLSDYTFKE